MFQVMRLRSISPSYKLFMESFRRHPVRDFYLSTFGSMPQNSASSGSFSLLTRCRIHFSNSVINKCLTQNLTHAHMRLSSLSEKWHHKQPAFFSSFSKSSDVINHRNGDKICGIGTILQKNGFLKAMRYSTMMADSADTVLSKEASAAGFKQGVHVAPKAVAYWIMSVASMVFAMVVLGGATRLTGSGLSMTEWRPQGSLPPMNDVEWEVEFQKYKKFPEYQKLNQDIDLGRFKQIYWMEYAHRMFGRAIGMAFALPLTYFAIRRQIPNSLYPRLAVLLGMGGMQGLIGWWMVKSGLDHTHIFGIDRDDADIPRVSPYRLTVHLTMAFATYGLLVWTGWNILKDRILFSMQPRETTKDLSLVINKLTRLRTGALVLASLVGITAFSGAFVAGNDAGYAYNDFPYMNGQWIPEDIWDDELRPSFRNLFENIATVQFCHRVLALSSLTATTLLFLRARAGGLFPQYPSDVRRALKVSTGLAYGQVILGITTLVNVVPLELGLAHQAGALALWTSVLYMVHSLRFLKRPHLAAAYLKAKF